MKISLVLFTIFVGVNVASFISYEGYKVYEIQPTNQDDLEFLHSLEDKHGFDVWSEIRSTYSPVSVMVTPKSQGYFEQLLNAHNIKYTYLHEDLERSITEERAQQEQRKAHRNLNNRIEFDQYYRFNEINEYLHGLVLEYPGIVTLESIGESLEGRELIVAKISAEPSSAERPIILIDGGIHAREWIAPATVTYIIDQLVTNSSNRYLYADVDWYILPVLNPDGYEYSHTTARMWRKSRSPGVFCWGTDPNRNYDFFWGTVGASANECAETFRGPSPASDIETVVYSTYVEKYASRSVLYLSFHSFGNYFLYPWGYINQAGPNGPELDDLARNAAAAIREAGGPVYTVGSSGVTLYPTSGSSVDWAYGAAGIPYSYTVELPQNSFIVPPENILPIVTQTFEGVRVFGDFVTNNYGRNKK